LQIAEEAQNLNDFQAAGITGRANPERQKSTQLGRLATTQAASLMGHEDAFPRPRLSARCGFGQGTFAGTRATGETRRFRSFAYDWSNE